MNRKHPFTDAGQLFPKPVKNLNSTNYYPSGLGRMTNIHAISFITPLITGTRYGIGPDLSRPRQKRSPMIDRHPKATRPPFRTSSSVYVFVPSAVTDWALDRHRTVPSPASRRIVARTGPRPREFGFAA